jgi:hypothetical protein
MPRLNFSPGPSVQVIHQSDPRSVVVQNVGGTVVNLSDNQGALDSAVDAVGNLLEGFVLQPGQVYQDEYNVGPLWVKTSAASGAVQVRESPRCGS